VTPQPSIAREAAISVVINAALSLGFFLAFLGTAPRLLQWGAPDYLALAFIPQSVVVALMSALVPALVVRRELGGILLRAVMFALGGGVLGAALSLVVAGPAPIAWSAALPMKMAYGGVLGALVAVLALRRLLSSAAVR
jgi:hypothetical protein